MKEKAFFIQKILFAHVKIHWIGLKSPKCDLNSVCAWAREWMSAFAPASIYINFIWSCQKVSYLQISDMRTQPRSSLRKTGFALFVLFASCWFSQSVFSAFAVALHIDADFFSLTLLKMLRLDPQMLLQCYVEMFHYNYVFFHFSSFIWAANRQRS